MRNVVLFIAMSLDGYIADVNGDVDWLKGQKENQDDMESYHEFVKEMDTVVMGKTTYEQIRNELSVDEWMYKDFKSYVVTHHQMTTQENIQFINEDVCEFIQRIRQEKGRSIWICGGASIAQPLIHAKLLNRLHISIIPTILGGGIPLFEKNIAQLPLRLLDTKNYNGIVDVIYEYRA